MSMRQLKITKSITNRESQSLEKYLQEIGKVELISPEEEVKLAIRIKQGDQKALDKLTKATTEEERFYALDAAAKTTFEAGKIDEARKYAQELQRLLPKFKGDWNYGNAIQDTNLVMGRIAVHESHIDDAKQYLLEAGKSPGSPQMDTFGPNMSLAKDLLEKGERETVLQYFELCRKFWKMDRDRLNAWRDEVKAGRIPDFGANLLY